MSTTFNRQERVRAIANYQKDLKDLTKDDYFKLCQQEDSGDDFNTAVMNSRYKKICHLISCTPILRNQKKINILSIDGGGIRVFIALIFLFEMEIQFRKNIITMFDMVGGSGFGGMVAAALSVSSHVSQNKPKYTPTDLMNFLNRNSGTIFHEKFQIETVYSVLYKIRRQYADMYGGSLYNGDGLQKCLQELFTPFRKMKDLIKPTFIPVHMID